MKPARKPDPPAVDDARITLRYDVDASLDDELDELAWDVNLDGLTYRQVRDWFRARLRPR